MIPTQTGEQSLTKPITRTIRYDAYTMPNKITLISKKYGTKHTFYRSITEYLEYDEGYFEAVIGREKPAMQNVPKQPSLY